MLYTSKQAASILGCTSGTLNKLVKEGKVQAEPRPEGNKRAHHHFKPAVIREFKKIYKNRLNGNGKRVKKLSLDNLPSPTGIISRLDKVETEVLDLKTKIDYLVKLWS